MSHKVNDSLGHDKKTGFKEPFQSVSTCTELLFVIQLLSKWYLTFLFLFLNSKSIWPDIPMALINLWNVPGVYLFFSCIPQLSLVFCCPSPQLSWKVQMVANSEWMHIFKSVWSLGIFFILFLIEYMLELHTFPAVFKVQAKLGLKCNSIVDSCHPRTALYTGLWNSALILNC